MVDQYHDCKHIFHIEPHGTDVSAGVRLLSEKTLLLEKNSPVAGGIRTQVLTDSMAIATSTLTTAPRHHLNTQEANKNKHKIYTIWKQPWLNG